MGLPFSGHRRFRKNFGTLNEVAPMPNLIEVQKSSYDRFLLIDIPADKRGDWGLNKIFKSVFPIDDFSGRSKLEFLRYTFDPPKYDVDECRQRGMTYAAALKATLRLIVFDIDEESESKSVLDIKEQEVYFCDLPLMTKNGTFVINGVERVVVSQMHRSPGVFFDHDKGKSHSSGKLLFSARIIPYRGSWLDFEFDPKDILNVRIDRRKKIPATTLLMSFGLSQVEILDHFYKKITYKYITSEKKWRTAFKPESIKGTKVNKDIINASTGKVALESGTKITRAVIDKLVKQGLKELLISPDDLIDKFIAEDMIDKKTGEVLVEAGQKIDESILETINKFGYPSIKVLDIDDVNIGPWIVNTLRSDKNESSDEAIVDLYRVMRPGEPPTLEAAYKLLEDTFFKPEKYDLSDVGRVKMNSRLGNESSDHQNHVLDRNDVLAVIKTLVDLRDGKGSVDDIDHLGNRRVRSVGELMENQFRLGLIRMQRALRERMGILEIDSIMPQELINAKPLASAIKEFFGLSQLSQFMDQTNPLSEITHKRRVSALGPGGLTRERAGFEVRDVHPTHYGRICPIETPEGPNIGLINSLATYAKINRYGFIESLYRKVVKGKVTNQIKYLWAMEEEKYTIAQANSQIDKNGNFVGDFIPCRKGLDVVMSSPEDIDYIDVSPKQVVSVASALIPFLENDDANRALMGSNMMRQAVPLVKTEAPLVGTGMEPLVAKDSGATIVAKRDGVIDKIDGKRIVVRVTNEKDLAKSTVDIYTLLKYQRSNQSTCINQRPLVRVGDSIKAGDVIADGPSTHLGELALGKNVVVAFMPWLGYNFEDSILISERLVRDDVFTSIHIEEYEINARDTKLGPEEITRDIPNVGEDALRNLDESGIVYVGAEVKAGDILVGKVTPKGESPITPEEKLLRAIFGEKATDVRDSSLTLPPASNGTIVEVRVFNRHGIEKDERALASEKEEINSLAKNRDAELSILEGNIYDRLKGILVGKTIAEKYKEISSGTILTEEILEAIERHLWWSLKIVDKKCLEDIEVLNTQYQDRKNDRQAYYEDKVNKIERGDELPAGVMKSVKVFVAVKRKLAPGDKMAGRHGNKGVISRIVPVEDMPYSSDGTTVDVVLNPLGVPSRMNIGQILETHLGWACMGLGRKIATALENYKISKNADDLKSNLKLAYSDGEYKDKIVDLEDRALIEFSSNLVEGVPISTPVFDGAHRETVTQMLKKADLDDSGQIGLFDGRTGVPFDRKVTVGIIYMLKLHHLVDDKIHARSIGPYSLVTQQPLGGKAQFGGQRFGEMEVWALEAYGAAYTLQEMLTVKSDDVVGRTRVYESLVRGDDTFETGVPESFNVLVKEIRSLGLNIEMSTRDDSI